MDKKIPPQLRDDNLSEETKILISSLPSDQNSMGKLYNYQGTWYYPNALQGVINFQNGFKPQDTDLILASLPKSGTTWLKALTFAILYRAKHRLSTDDHPLLSNNPHGLIPFLEVNMFLKSSNPDLTMFSSTSSTPRIFSTHLPLHTLQVPFKEKPCKIVYVCRNVKDVVVSQWHFRSSFQEQELDETVLEPLFESFCRGVTYYGPFWEHLLSYWVGSLKYPKHILFMRYEELKAEPFAQIKRLAEFLDCPFTEEEEHNGSIETVFELCSLSHLSSLEINKTGRNSNNIPHHSYFRNGQVGDYKNYLTPEMENKIDMIIEEKYKGSGLKF